MRDIALGGECYVRAGLRAMWCTSASWRDPAVGTIVMLAAVVLESHLSVEVARRSPNPGHERPRRQQLLVDGWPSSCLHVPADATLGSCGLLIQRTAQT